MGSWELKLFKEIATHRSMSKGATQCRVSQSAASQHVQEVERRLGLQLFDRSKRPLELTEAGELYAEYCRDVLRREEELSVALEELRGDVKGTLRVASIYSVGLSEMGRIKEQFAARYPEVRLDVEFMRPERVYEAVLGEAAELGVVSYPESTREIAAIAWRREEMRVAACPSHPLASRAVLSAADLAGQDFIGFDEDLSIRRETDRFLKARGVEVRLVMHFDNIQTIKEAVALGSGVSILPACTMRGEVAQGRLAAIPLDAEELARPVGVVHRRRKKPGRAAQAFIQLLLEK